MRKLSEVRKAVLAAIDQHREQIIAIGEYVWRNPEAGYREFKTSQKAAEVLESLGLSVKKKLGVTGLRADLDSGRPGPVLAVLGEMDALILPSHPESDESTGAVHACGHNCHITAMLGAAIGLCHSRAADALSGKIAFIANPAEECIEFASRLQLMAKKKILAIGGKCDQILRGVFRDVDMAIMNHVGTGENYGAAGHNGFIVKNVIFHGKSCHAAWPARGVNALNAATLAQNAVAMLRETFTDSSIRVHGIMTNGGDVVNIIPDNVRMEYMLRADSLDKIKHLSQLFDQAMLGAAMALGAQAEIITTPGYMTMENDEALGEVFRDAVHLLHPEAVVNINTGFSTGSTDMGDVSHIMPAIHASVPGTGGTGHGIDYHVADPEKAYIENAKILALMAVELLYGNADKGREIAARRCGCISQEQYRAEIAELSYVSKSPGL
ncbi:MAG: amidohydrolase [Lentisphaerae bacterium]|nr:amidohydrolase [Lentisphaerota bacterium]